MLYLNDGQNLFDAATSTFTGREWRVDETVRELTATGSIPPIVVVGIDHGGRRERFREYFPWVDRFLDPPEPDPQGARYPAFLVDEVIPFVEARYRVAREPEQRGIGGSSAGGLAAINAVVTRPGVFGRLLVESPSIYVDDAHILKAAAGVTTWPSRIALGAGTAEGAPRACDTARQDGAGSRRRSPPIHRGVAQRRRGGCADPAHCDAVRNARRRRVGPAPAGRADLPVCSAVAARGGSAASHRDG